jgi:glycine hydroxymethyltransferase
VFHRSQTIAQDDPEVWDAITAEHRRQEDHIELIASENYASPAVLAAQGSQLTNKYAEGYPGKRYYGGCQYVDVVEQLAIDRVKKLFHADYANVQSHSGATANQAVFFAALKPGDTVLGMSLRTAGHPDARLARQRERASGSTSSPYGLDPKTELIDYDAAKRSRTSTSRTRDRRRVCVFARHRLEALPRHRRSGRRLPDGRHGALRGVDRRRRLPDAGGHCRLRHQHTHKTLRGPRGGMILANAEFEKLCNAAVFPGCRGGPLMHVIAAKAVAFGEALGKDFRHYQQQVLDNARVLSTVLQERGLRIVSGGTDSHMFLVDLRAKKITGKDAEARLQTVGITCNKNAIPNDPEKPFVTSGIRLGSPAITTRGFTELECEELAHSIADVLDAPTDDAALAKVRGSVHALTHKFPVYG